MHWTLELTYSLALWVGVGALWRPVSFVLLAGWTVAQFWFHISGNSTPIGIYIFMDLVALLAVWRWRSSVYDLAIALIFPIMWVAYFMADATLQWWVLYWLAMTQFVLAGPWPQISKITGSQQHGPIRELPDGVS